MGSEMCIRDRHSRAFKLLSVGNVLNGVCVIAMVVLLMVLKIDIARQSISVYVIVAYAYRYCLQQ